MKKLSIIPILFLSLSLFGTKYYVTPRGNDDNNGADTTAAHAWRTWHYAFNHVTPGDTVYFRGGIYPPYSTSVGASITGSVVDGTHDNPTCFFNYPGENPIMDCQTMTQQGNYGINLAGVSHLYFKGLEVRNIRQTSSLGLAFGWYLRYYLIPCTNVRLENCKASYSGSHGFHTYGVDSVYFINCDAWMCCDSLTVYDPGGTGDGWQIYNHSSDGYVYFSGCRAWRCSDQGFENDSRAEIVWDNCWSINNGNYQIGQKKGSGWKHWIYESGWNNDAVVQITMRNCVAAYNNLGGINFTDAPNKVRAHIYNNFSYGQKLIHIQKIIPGITYDESWDYENPFGHGFYVPAIPDTTGSWDNIFRNNISYDNAGYIGWGAGGDVLTGLNIESNNRFDYDASTTSDADFASLDTTGMCGARQADGSLPITTFGHLAPTSDLINAGIDVGIAYNGDAPDLGAYEYSTFAEEPSSPYIATTTPYSITANSAITGGYMISDGGGTISAKGICWGASANPGLSDTVISGGTGTADFTVTISGLVVNTTYYCRAYATNEVGTTYGANEQFTTSQSSIIKHGGKIVKR